MLRTLRLSVLYLALAATTFFGVAALMRGFVPWPTGLGLQAKVEYFEAHKDEFDTIFIGSSRTVRGLDNRLVEARLREAGVEMNSFNLAVGGMRTFEQDFLLREILAMKPANLTRVFFEGGPVGMGVREDHIFRAPPNLETERGIHWHSPRETANVLGAIRGLPLPPWRRFELAGTHAMLCAWKLANGGRGEAILRERRRPPRLRRMREETIRKLAAGGGHQGLEQATGREASAEMEALRANPAPFEARMAALPGENAQEVPLDRLNLSVYRAQARLAAEAGVELVYFIPPGHEGSPERLRLSEVGEIRELLDFNDPKRYPELFRLDHRFDKGHLNRRGVVLFSNAFADAILESGRPDGRDAGEERGEQQ